MMQFQRWEIGKKRLGHKTDLPLKLFAGFGVDLGLPGYLLLFCLWWQCGAK